MNHKWFENSRTHHTTVRICERCEIRKLSRHETENGKMIHWTEFYRGSERILCEATPKCEPQEVMA
jgi:hypothetical protein